MARLFERFKKRKFTDLNGFWRFKTDAEKKGEQEKWFCEFPSESAKMCVPSCYNNSFGLLTYMGLAWYNREITINSSDALLEFEAVLGYAKVWLDGKLLGEHYGGYTAFSFYLPLHMES